MPTYRQREILRIPTTRTIHSYGSNVGDGEYGRANNSLMVPVGQDSDDNQIDYCVLEWDFSVFEHFLTGDDWRVASVELSYYYRLANTLNPIVSVDFVDIVTDLSPSNTAAVALFEAVGDGSIYETQSLGSNNKAFTSIVLGDEYTSTICDEMTDRLIAHSHFAIAIRKSGSGSGAIQIGGQNMSAGVSTSWNASSSTTQSMGLGTSINEPPYLIVHLEGADVTHVDFDMRYTTSDPTTTQETPSNSIGGFIASNDVYTRTQLSNHLNVDDTSMSLDSAGTLPNTTTRLVQVGPEIIKFDTIDSTNFILRGLERGVAPKFVSPATTVPYGEYVGFMDISRLFDKPPLTDRDEYRCIAFVESATSPSAENIKLHLVQDANANVEIDIGIEIPKHQKITSTIVSTVASGSSSVVVSGRTEASGTFTGSMFTIGSFTALITGHDLSGSNASLSLASSFTEEFSGGTSCSIGVAPAQRLADRHNAPTGNSGRFLGFINGDGASNEVSLNDIVYSDTSFYVWVKKSDTKNSASKPDSGAVIIIMFDRAGS